jgi:hypothetical protein
LEPVLPIILTDAEILDQKMIDCRLSAQEDEDENENHPNLLRRTTMGNGSHAFLFFIGSKLI